MRYKHLIILLLLPLIITANDGTKSAFIFVNVEHSPRIEALGGSAIAVFDGDVTLSQTTPSLLTQSMHNDIAFTFGDYFSDISLLSFSYARNFRELGTIGISLKAIQYGEFYRNDNFGYNQGFFSANDQVLTFGIGKRIYDKLYFGTNLNLLSANYDSYVSFAILSNVSSTYFNAEKKFSATLLFKNIGRQLNPFAIFNESVPFEIQFALSKELAYLPFRYHLTYNNINNFDIKSPYKLREQTNIDTGQLEIKDESIAKTFLRHVIIGGELNPFRKSLFIRGGFNFQRRFDMSIISRPVMVGFSWGLGFRLSKYYFDYSRSSYHISGIPNNFSIATNLSTFGL